MYYNQGFEENGNSYNLSRVNWKLFCFSHYVLQSGVLRKMETRIISLM